MYCSPSLSLSTSQLTLTFRPRRRLWGSSPAICGVVIILEETKQQQKKRTNRDRRDTAGRRGLKKTFEFFRRAAAAPFFLLLFFSSLPRQKNNSTETRKALESEITLPFLLLRLPRRRRRRRRRAHPRAPLPSSAEARRLGGKKKYSTSSFSLLPIFFQSLLSGGSRNGAEPRDDCHIEERRTADGHDEQLEGKAYKAVFFFT